MEVDFKNLDESNLQDISYRVLTEKAKDAILGPM